MAKIWIDNVADYGIISDVPAHKLPFGAWSDGNNVEFREDQVLRMSGHEQVFGTPTIAPYYLQPWQDTSTYYWFYANATKIYRTDGSSHTDVTNTTRVNYSAASLPIWNGGTLGGIPIMNNQALVDDPQEWDPGTSKFIDLTNWPANWQCKVIRTFGQFLVALWLNKSSTQYPTLIHWSDAAAVGAVPANWTPAATNDAGSKDLADTTDQLVDCLPLGELNVIYKNDSIWTMRYIGGNDIFAFKKTPLAFGARSQNSMIEFDSKHLVVTKGDVRAHNTQVSESVINARMRRRLFNVLDTNYGSYVRIQHHPPHNEIWIGVPTTDSNGLMTMAFIWNYKYNTWTIRDLPSIAWMGLGFVDSSAADTTYDGGSGVTFDADTGVFDGRVYNPNENHILLADPGNTKIFEAETTNQFDGSNYLAYVERTGIPLGYDALKKQLIVDHDSDKTITKIYPQFTVDTGSVNIYIGTQDYVNEAVTWDGPYAFDPSTDQFVSVFVTGKLIGIKVQSQDDHQWNLQRIGFEVEYSGVGS